MIQVGSRGLERTPLLLGSVATSGDLKMSGRPISIPATIHSIARGPLVPSKRVKADIRRVSHKYFMRGDSTIPIQPFQTDLDREPETNKHTLVRA